MPRIAVLADIHGNLRALEAVLCDLEQYVPVEAIVVAGDLTGGPGDEAVLRWMLDMDATPILGNWERRVIELVSGTAPEYMYSAKQFALQRWTPEHVSREMLDMLCALPEQRVISLPGCDPILVVHGSPRSASEKIRPDRTPQRLAEIMAVAAQPVTIFGHTHVYWQVWQNGRLAFNPGAVSFPEGQILPDGRFEGGAVGARYALLDWDGSRWMVTPRLVSYDMAALKRDYQQSGFVTQGGPLARAFLLDILTGQMVMMPFFHYASRLAREAGFGDWDYIPNQVWDRAEAEYDWQKWED